MDFILEFRQKYVWCSASFNILCDVFTTFLSNRIATIEDIRANPSSAQTGKWLGIPVPDGAGLQDQIPCMVVSNLAER